MPKTLFEAISGNVIGIVEEPDDIPKGKSRAESCLVKIGAINRLRKFSKADALIVIRKLKAFAKALLSSERRKT